VVHILSTLATPLPRHIAAKAHLPSRAFGFAI
jgi:hypothetical protein